MPIATVMISSLNVLMSALAILDDRQGPYCQYYCSFDFGGILV